MTVQFQAASYSGPIICRRMIDVFAAIVVIVFSLDTLPCTPSFVRSGMEPLLDGTGLWQGTWSLFAPFPDSRNHRLRADFHYCDGTHCVWISPDWRSVSNWKRFTGHRETEFLEKLFEGTNQPVWYDFAMTVARQEGFGPNRHQQPEKIFLSVMWEDIPPPAGDVWKSATGPDVEMQERVFYSLTDRK